MGIENYEINYAAVSNTFLDDRAASLAASRRRIKKSQLMPVCFSM
jgi:hypothetical protein